MYSYATCMTSRPEPDRLTTMFTLMPRHERTFCGGSTSDRPGVALWSSGSPLLLQFMFTLTPQSRSVPAVCGHHTFAFSCNGTLPGPQLTSSSRSWSHWLSWQHSGAGIGSIRTFAFTLTMKRYLLSFSGSLAGV